MYFTSLHIAAKAVDANVVLLWMKVENRVEDKQTTRYVLFFRQTSFIPCWSVCLTNITNIKSFSIISWLTSLSECPCGGLLRPLLVVGATEWTICRLSQKVPAGSSSPRSQTGPVHSQQRSDPDIKWHSSSQSPRCLIGNPSFCAAPESAVWFG